MQVLLLFLCYFKPFKLQDSFINNTSRNDFYAWRKSSKKWRNWDSHFVWLWVGLLRHVWLYGSLNLPKILRVFMFSLDLKSVQTKRLFKTSKVCFKCPLYFSIILGQSHLMIPLSSISAEIMHGLHSVILLSTITPKWISGSYLFFT